MNVKETKKNIIHAGHIAVEELIKVAKEAIVDSDDDISADRLKNAAATKKLAIFDAFEILNRIVAEQEILEDKPKEVKKETIWLHNTGGGSRPDWTVNGMKNDIVKDKEGSPVLDENGNIQLYQVASCYIIGRKSSSTNESLWDGKILRKFDDRYWAHHLGIKDNDVELNSKSISIDL